MSDCRVRPETGLRVDVRAPHWRKAPLNQMLLDHLLAVSISQHPQRPHGDTEFVFLYPAVNFACARAARDYTARVRAETFTATTLETVVGALRSCSDAKWIEDFHGRYLNYGRAVALNQGLERAPR